MKLLNSHFGLYFGNTPTMPKERKAHTGAPDVSL